MDTILCPGCGKLVDDAHYVEHTKGDATNGPHVLHTVNIAGTGGPVMVQSNPKGPRILDIPYLGRVRADAFFAWTFFSIFLGVLMGLRII